MFKKLSIPLAAVGTLAAVMLGLTAGPAAANDADTATATPSFLCFSTDGLAGVSTFGQVWTHNDSSLFHEVYAHIKDTKGGDGNRAGLRIYAWLQNGTKVGEWDLVKSKDTGGTQTKSKTWPITAKIYKVRVAEILVNKQGEVTEASQEIPSGLTCSPA